MLLLPDCVLASCIGHVLAWDGTSSQLLIIWAEMESEALGLSAQGEYCETNPGCEFKVQ